MAELQKYTLFSVHLLSVLTSFVRLRYDCNKIFRCIQLPVPVIESQSLSSIYVSDLYSRVKRSIDESLSCWSILWFHLAWKVRMLPLSSFSHATVLLIALSTLWHSFSLTSDDISHCNHPLQQCTGYRRRKKCTYWVTFVQRCVQFIVYFIWC